MVHPAVLIASEDAAKENNMPIIARIIDYATGS